MAKRKVVSTEDLPPDPIDPINTEAQARRDQASYHEILESLEDDELAVTQEQLAVAQATIAELKSRFKSMALMWTIED